MSTTPQPEFQLHMILDNTVLDDSQQPVTIEMRLRVFRRHRSVRSPTCMAKPNVTQRWLF